MRGSENPSKKSVFFFGTGFWRGATPDCLVAQNRWFVKEFRTEGSVAADLQHAADVVHLVRRELVFPSGF